MFSMGDSRPILGVRVEPALKARLKQIAKAERRSFSSLVRNTLEDFAVSKDEQQQPQKPAFFHRRQR